MPCNGFRITFIGLQSEVPTFINSVRLKTGLWSVEVKKNAYEAVPTSQPLVNSYTIDPSPNVNVI